MNRETLNTFVYAQFVKTLNFATWCARITW